MKRSILRIQKLARRASRIFRQGAVILAYHRVADLVCDPHHLAVSPARFAEHVDYITRTCTVMPLQELGRALHERELPPRAVAITFDDGYLDVFEQARPIMKAAHSPATIFVPVGLIGEEREFWPDELDRILHCSEALPEHLTLSIRGQSYSWNTVSPGQRDGAFWAVWNLIKPLHHEERIQVLDELGEWAGPGQKCREGFRPMNADELYRLSLDGWEIGAHTVTHAVLSNLTGDEQRREIAGGRKMLTDLVGGPVLGFAYPHGSTEDFTAETAAIVREAGFALACTMIPGSAKAGDDPFRLKRCAVFDWPVDTFANQLDSFFV